MALLNDERFARKSQGLYRSIMKIFVVVYKQTFLDCRAQTPPGK